jgi:hypothetical protein
LPFDVAGQEVKLHATLVDVCVETGKATAIRRIVVGDTSATHDGD